MDLHLELEESVVEYLDSIGLTDDLGPALEKVLYFNHSVY